MGGAGQDNTRTCPKPVLRFKKILKLVLSPFS